MLGGRLMRGGGEVLVAASSPAAVRDGEPVARLREIVQQLARVGVVDDGSHRHRQLDRRAVAPGAIAAFAVPASLGGVLGIEAEVQQRVVVLARDHHHVAAAPAVAAARAPARHIFLAPERKTTVAAVARLHADSDFINEHRGC